MANVGFVDKVHGVRRGKNVHVFPFRKVSLKKVYSRKFHLGTLKGRKKWGRRREHFRLLEHSLFLRRLSCSPWEARAREYEKVLLFHTVCKGGSSGLDVLQTRGGKVSRLLCNIRTAKPSDPDRGMNGREKCRLSIEPFGVGKQVKKAPFDGGGKERKKE